MMERCSYGNCNKEAVIKGFVFVKESKSRTVEVVACEEHSKQPSFFPQLSEQEKLMYIEVENFIKGNPHTLPKEEISLFIEEHKSTSPSLSNGDTVKFCIGQDPTIYTVISEEIEFKKGLPSVYLDDYSGEVGVEYLTKVN
jgi:hypothetical protein